MGEQQDWINHILGLDSSVFYYYTLLIRNNKMGEGNEYCARCGCMLSWEVAKTSRLLYDKPLCGKCINESGLAPLVATDIDKAKERVEKIEREIVEALCIGQVKVDSVVVMLLGSINNFYGVYSLKSTGKSEKK